mmetsp:Transcript_45905/g.82068  ORF Transcript_45905/g.82068 Transcript_45905/m.82068 type:complete len:275 (-) Transcript_45905:1050-1874(-)
MAFPAGCWYPLTVSRYSAYGDWPQIQWICSFTDMVAALAAIRQIVWCTFWKPLSSLGFRLATAASFAMAPSKCAKPAQLARVAPLTGCRALRFLAGGPERRCATIPSRARQRFATCSLPWHSARHARATEPSPCLGLFRTRTRQALMCSGAGATGPGKVLRARKRKARTSCTSALRGRRFRAQGIWWALSRSVTSVRQCWTRQRMATLVRAGPCSKAWTFSNTNWLSSDGHRQDTTWIHSCCPADEEPAISWSLGVAAVGRSPGAICIALSSRF